VYAGGLALDDALSAVGTDGAVLRDELARIGYAGTVEPGFARPHVYLELHIEQGPVLEHEGCAIGAVDRLQGISWQRVTIDGSANHAGTTPIAMRRDAGLAAARVATFLRDRVVAASAHTVATVGSLVLEPGVINIIPSRATFTVDLRDPDETRLRAAEAMLDAYLRDVAAQENVAVSVERLVRLEPVAFDAGVCDMVERAAAERGLKARRMTSGAGHDAQMIARMCPAAMIFVPSRDGISHNPREHTDPEQLVAGANVMLDVVARLASGSDTPKAS
jgi:beta-ureidopropionase / N-carbamoyl-L-amino-acid hydrolase